MWVLGDPSVFLGGVGLWMSGSLGSSCAPGRVAYFCIDVRSDPSFGHHDRMLNVDGLDGADLADVVCLTTDDSLHTHDVTCEPNGVAVCRRRPPVAG